MAFINVLIVWEISKNTYAVLTGKIFSLFYYISLICLLLYWFLIKIHLFLCSSLSFLDILLDSKIIPNRLVYLVKCFRYFITFYSIKYLIIFSWETFLSYLKSQFLIHTFLIVNLHFIYLYYLAAASIANITYNSVMLGYL